MNLEKHTSNSKVNTKYSDTLLLLFLSITFVSTAGQFAIRVLVERWYDPPFKYFQVGFWLVQNLGFFLIPLSIKDKSLKILGFIITSIMVCYWVYSSVDFLIG